MSNHMRGKRHKPPAPAGKDRQDPRRGESPSPPVALLAPVTEPEPIPRVEEWVQTPCPYCAEELEVLVRSDEDGQIRREECLVCCRQVTLHITWDDGELQVEADRA